MPDTWSRGEKGVDIGCRKGEITISGHTLDDIKRVIQLARVVEAVGSDEEEATVVAEAAKLGGILKGGISASWRDYVNRTVIIKNGKTDKAKWYLKNPPIGEIEEKKSRVKSNKDKTMYYLKERVSRADYCAAEILISLSKVEWVHDKGDVGKCKCLGIGDVGTLDKNYTFEQVVEKLNSDPKYRNVTVIVKTGEYSQWYLKSCPKNIIVDRIQNYRIDKGSRYNKYHIWYRE